MKKTLFAALLLTASLFGSEAIVKQKCTACHMIDMPFTKKEMMKLTPQERMAKKQAVMKTMKAPPLSKVSAKLKYEFGNDKAKFTAFVKDYLRNPSADKSKCMPIALKRFGVMPPIGKGLSDAELDSVASWLYTHFDTQWNPGEQQRCQGQKGPMKCGAGKCGQSTAKPAMKCGAGKCGGN